MNALTIFNADHRLNAANKSMGRRLSFQSEIPGGDIRKHLKATGIKGKALTSAVNRVLRGDDTASFAMFEATVSAARSGGFKPTFGDLNKKGDLITLKLQKPSTPQLDKSEVIEAATEALSVDDLLAMIAAKEEAAAKAKAINV